MEFIDPMEGPTLVNRTKPIPAAMKVSKFALITPAYLLELQHPQPFKLTTDVSNITPMLDQISTEIQFCNLRARRPDGFSSLSKPLSLVFMAQESGNT